MLFAVALFNEELDAFDVDTVLLLRPTQSATVVHPATRARLRYFPALSLL